MPRILTLPENTKGRDFVVGDIHGVYELLETALEAAKFDPAKDRLISVGDLIDRGHSSPRCLEFLQKPWFFAVKGNHEEAFLDICREDGSFDAAAAKRNIKNGMGWLFGQSAENIAACRKAFADLPIAIEVSTRKGTVGFVHADIEEGMDWQTFKKKIEEGDEDTILTALWSRERVNLRKDSGVAGIDRVFFGHTPQENGPRRLGNCYYVDTGGVYRVLHGELAAEYFLTVCEITARSQSISGPALNSQDHHKVIMDPPQKKKPFGSAPK